MAYQPYDFLFTDQNPNREFVVQPYTRNGPSSPDGGIDPSAATANTTLFLYGKGTPDYGDRIQENLIYMLEHFFSTVEPSFPIPGQIWCQSSTNELTQPFQLYFFNPRKFIITMSSGNNIYVQSDDGSQTPAQVQARFQSLGTARQFTVYSPSYQLSVFVQSALPTISGPSVILTVNPVTPVTSMAGSYIGGWEEVYSGNCEVVLRRPFNAGGFNLVNLANPVNPQDAATKAYVDSAVVGGSIALADLSDVSITAPVTGQILQFNGIKWFNSSLAAQYLPLSGGTMTGAINMNGSGINNLPLPTGTYDAANKLYVDEQPLSGANVVITSPNNLDLLFYNTSSSKWNNGNAATAGVVPIAGGVTMTGPLSMGGQVLTGVPTPVNPTDAANMAYVLAQLVSSGGVVSGSFLNTTGTLTLNNAAGPPVVINGFLPTPNNTVPAPEVAVLPQNSGQTSLVVNQSLPPQGTVPPNQFFPATLGAAVFNNNGAAVIESPLQHNLGTSYNQLDIALGNFVVPKQHLVFPAPGTRTVFDFNKLAFATPAFAPGVSFVKGSHGLNVYLNGVKQLESTSAKATITGVTIGGTYSATFAPAGITVTGNVTGVLHQGVEFVVSGTGGVSPAGNDGAYTVLTSSLVGGNTLVTVEPNIFAQIPGTTPLNISAPGTITYAPSFLRDDMETGYLFPAPSTVKTFSLAVNGNPTTTVSIDVGLNNCSSLGSLRSVINAYAQTRYINAITNATGLQFTVPGNRAAQFPASTSFTVNYSASNNGTYTVSGTGSVYNSGPNTTTINVTTSIPVTATDGVIFQNQYAFSVAIENGSFVIRSCVPGSTSSIASFADGGLFAGITGITFPLTFTALSTQGNALAPTDYAYYEVGMNGYQSSLVVFNTAPLNTDVFEVAVDREMVYTAVNPLTLATIA